MSVSPINAGTFVKITSRQDDRFSETRIGVLLRESKSYMSQMSSKHFPCLLLDKGCNNPEFRSPIQTMFHLIKMLRQAPLTIQW